MHVTQAKQFCLKQISSLLQIGFFQEMDNSKPEAILEELEKKFGIDDARIARFLDEEALGIKGLKQRIIQELILLNPQRSYSNHDTEWVYQEGDYSRFLKKLVPIAGGLFKLNSISEDWTDEGEIHISIQTEEAQWRMGLTYRGDWADVAGVLSSLNGHITGGGYYFVFDEEVIVFVRDEEKEKLMDMQVELLRP